MSHQLRIRVYDHLVDRYPERTPGVWEDHSGEFPCVVGFWVSELKAFVVYDRFPTWVHASLALVRAEVSHVRKTLNSVLTDEQRKALKGAGT